jgi:hypothetical protein
MPEPTLLELTQRYGNYCVAELTRGEDDFPVALIDTAGWTEISRHTWSELTLPHDYSETGMWKVLARLLKNKKLKPFQVGG